MILVKFTNLGESFNSKYLVFKKNMRIRKIRIYTSVIEHVGIIIAHSQGNLQRNTISLETSSQELHILKNSH